MPQCGGCGASSPDDKRFCGECGTPLRLRCSSCGSTIELGRRFCGDCGTPVGGDALAVAAPAPAVPDPVPVAERRLCSVLFVDLVGFTTVSESRDAEDTRELLSQYFEVATTIVGRYGGVIEKFIGDAVVAGWGAPDATEEDAERAVRAALDLVDTVTELGTRAGITGLAARAGVLTGEVAVTIGARNEGMIAGDAVNTASRIQSVATPGSVFVDATTCRLTSTAISYADEGEHTLKGKTAAERLWCALRVVSSVGGVQRIDGLEAPLTGRGAEVRSLRELFHASVERRQPRLVLVSGPAGIGKSRLGWEFEKYVDGLADGVWWHRGRCLSYGDGLVYWALAEVVRQRFSIAEDDPPAVAADKLRQGLVEHVSDANDRDFISLRLARLLGAETDSPESDRPLTRDDLFAGWRRLFEQLAMTEPVVILIEDAHHAADELLDFLDHLVDWARDLPIFVLVFARPEIDDRRPGFGSGRNRVSITLDPLDAASMDQLVEALIPGTRPDNRSLIVGHAEGIPLYAMETIRALIDRSIVQPVEGRYRLVGDIGELGVPDSLHALLAARLDALDPTARRVVADAAVLGVSFPAEAVTAVSDLDADTTRTVLTELLRREVLEISADPLSPERGSYRFTQELLRQVAYDTLSRRDRKSRHLAVAAHLRATFPGDGEEVIDAIARHYVDALHAVPDDNDQEQLADLAIDALSRAAERALRTGSPGRAMTAYDDAAQLLAAQPDPGPVRAATLWLEATQAARLLGSDSMEAFAERAKSVYEACGDIRGQARATMYLGRAKVRQGRFAEADELLNESLGLLQGLDAEPDIDTLHVIVNLAQVATGSGSRDSDRLTAEALALGQALDADDITYARLLVARANHLDNEGERRLAAMYMNEGGRLALAGGDNSVAANAFMNLASVLNIDRPAEAIEPGRRAFDLLSPLGDRYAIGFALTNVALAQLAIGDWDAAHETLFSLPHPHVLEHSGMVVITQTMARALRGDLDSPMAHLDRAGDLIAGDPLESAALATGAAFAAEARGDRADALRLALQGLDLARDVAPFGEDNGRWAWPLAARCAHALQQFDLEVTLVEMCEQLPRAKPAPMQRAEATLIRARLGSVGHDPDVDADERFPEAIAQLRELSTPYHLAHGLLDHAEHLLAAGHPARACVDEARSIGERLGCGPLLERADHVDDFAVASLTI